MDLVKEVMKIVIERKEDTEDRNERAGFTVVATEKTS